MDLTPLFNTGTMYHGPRAYPSYAYDHHWGLLMAGGFNGPSGSKKKAVRLRTGTKHAYTDTAKP